MNATRHSISAFFPAYNDEASIGRIVNAVVELLPKFTDDFEVVVVNDGSTDQTGEILSLLAQRYPFIKVIHHPTNRGYGAALITGFSNCSKDLIFYTDGDGQYDVAELPRLLDVFDDRVDLVNGYKTRRADPWYRIVAGSLYRRIVRLLFGIPLRDVDCDFRIFRRSLIGPALLTCDSGAICVEMIKKFQKQGCRMVEVPVSHYPRIKGRSQFFRLRHLRRMFLELFPLWWRLIAVPTVLRFFALVGLQSQARGKA